MKFIRQISTGKIVYRESPHTDQALSNAANDSEIAESDLEIVEESLTNQQWTDKINNDRPWEEKMAETDSGMPRYLEDHIKDDHNEIAGNEFLQAKYDEKKALRATKP